MLVIDDGERLAPVALPGEQPVTQPIGTPPPATASRFQPADGGRDPGLLAQGGAVEPGHAQVQVAALAGERLRPRARGAAYWQGAVGEPVRGRLQYRPDRQPEPAGELQVPLVVRGHRHDRARTVG